MPNVVAIAGSPSHPSRSFAVLEYARRAALERGTKYGIYQRPRSPARGINLRTIREPRLKSSQ
jgi:hypothetical protein